MSNFWSAWIIFLSTANIVACYWLVGWVTKKRKSEAKSGDVTGHAWDGLEEYNNPLPGWWLQMYYLTIIFSVGYLALYPGLGTFPGLLGWTKENQHTAEMVAAQEKYGPIFAQYANTPVEELVGDKDAIKLGSSLYATYCTVCHGSDARGARGYPNLADKDWIFGGTPEAIKASIASGRNSIGMPAYAEQFSDEEITQIVSHVESLSGREVDPALAAAGAANFTTTCAACHMPDGTGMTALGAPNLTDDIWLYGGSSGVIKQTVLKGRKGVMPAHQEFLGDDKVHLLTAFIYSLSQDK